MQIRCRILNILKKYKIFASICAICLVLSVVKISSDIFKSGSRRTCSADDSIDVVYTWVNGSDRIFLDKLNSYFKPDGVNKKEFSGQRFDDKYELKFSLRSLEKYAPWVRHVYIVTNGQIPYWLNLDYEKVTLVTHEEIFLDRFDLPSFSSPAIEVHLHRIPGLSKRFIYFNDDIFLGSPLYVDDFYSDSRGFLIYLAWPLPMCSSDCPWIYVADGQCDNACYNVYCQFDGGDCEKKQKGPNRGHENILDRIHDDDIIGDYDQESNLNYVQRRILQVPSSLERNFHNLNIPKTASNEAKASNLQKANHFHKASNLQKVSNLQEASNLQEPSNLQKASILQDASHLQKVSDLQKASHLQISPQNSTNNINKKPNHNLVLNKFLQKRNSTSSIYSLKNQGENDNRIGDNRNKDNRNKDSRNKDNRNEKKNYKTNRIRDRLPITGRESINLNNSHLPMITRDSDDNMDVTLNQKVLSHAHLNASNTTINLTTLIEKHNKRVMKLDKLRRKRRIKKADNTKYFKPLLNTADFNSGKPANLNGNLTLGGNSTLISKIRSSINTAEAYGLSLQHSNRIFNLKYGFTPRYVPAHTAIMVDRDIMEEMQKTFNKEIQITSRNRLRSADDMQYSFSYYYYLVHEKSHLDIGEVFDLFDTDGSGTWSDREIRTLLTKLYDLPLSYMIVDHFEYVLTNCSKDGTFLEVPTPEYERYIDSKLPTISKELISNCPLLKEIFLEHFGFQNKYKHEVFKNTQAKYVTFKMLTSNISEVVGHLDEIRRRPSKFVCLNDNLDYEKAEENELVRAILYDFYLSLFPHPSKFELPSEYRNRFLYKFELDQWKGYHFKLKMCIYFFLIILFYITAVNLCKKRFFCWFFNKIFC